MTTTASKRSFLFLQGPCSPLFASIADILQKQGHAVHKIHFNSGDVAYWGPRKAHWFRGHLETLPEFLAEIWQKHQITDQILFGDCRPIHRPAITQAKNFGIRNHVFECGYFRPLWITLEREGVNDYSQLPKDPDWFRTISKQLPKKPKPQDFHSPFSYQATYDVLYHLAGAYNPLLFPHYRTHVAVTAPVEYTSYIKRFIQLKLIRRQETQLMDSFIGKQEPYFLLPLQLNTDSQIVNHSDFDGMADVLNFVITSFAQHAPKTTRLLIKNHPLDQGLVNYRKIIAGLSNEYGLANRILYLETGNIGTLLDHATGMITVNSTSGCLALERRRPTITLADPIYNMPGLTHQGHLDDFWTALPKPDKKLFTSFKNTVIYTTQINGSLYAPEGIKIASDNVLRVLLANQSPLEALL